MPEAFLHISYIFIHISDQICWKVGNRNEKTKTGKEFFRSYDISYDVNQCLEPSFAVKQAMDQCINNRSVDEK